MRGLLSRRALASIAVGVCMLAACGDDGSSAATTVPVSGGITVFAASSLTAAFKDIGAAFEAQVPGTMVTLNFAASSDLVTQINQGAPVDVFASADQANVKKLTTPPPAGSAVFATNSLQIIVAPGNPKHITTVADLARPDVTFVTGAADVPIGKYTQQVLAKAGVKVTPKSLEANVKAIVSKVTLGEADAGAVYVTDVLAAGSNAAGVVIPTDLNVRAEYPIVVLAGAPNAATASAFVAFVLSPAGQDILKKYGFSAP